MCPTLCDLILYISLDSLLYFVALAASYKRITHILNFCLDLAARYPTTFLETFSLGLLLVLFLVRLFLILLFFFIIVYLSECLHLHEISQCKNFCVYLAPLLFLTPFI